MPQSRGTRTAGPASSHDLTHARRKGKPLFRGRFEHSIDEKGRLAIPSRFRSDLCANEGEADTTVVVTNFHQCLVAYPLPEWEALEKKLLKTPQLEPRVLAFQRYFVGGATECPIDKAGRILIPANLRQHAGLERDCVIAGQLNKFEIWSQERWQREFEVISDQFNTMAAALGELGIQI